VATTEVFSGIEEILSVGKTNNPGCTDQEWKKVLDNALSAIPDSFSDHQFAQLSPLLTSYATNMCVSVILLHISPLKQTFIIKWCCAYAWKSECICVWSIVSIITNWPDNSSASGGNKLPRLRSCRGLWLWIDAKWSSQ